MVKSEPLKVLVVSSEAAPFAKSGGLGDVVGSLPRILKDRGADIRVVIPKYRSIKNEHFIGINYLGSFETILSWRKQPAGILLKDDGIKTYFVENDYYFGREGYYGYGDDNERFAFFCKAVLEMLRFIDFYPDIIHCNDWQTALVPVYLNLFYRGEKKFRDLKTVLTIHNIQYQGKYGMEMVQDVLDKADLILLDIKSIDETMCETITGASNRNALATLRYREERGMDVWIRHVVVPGYTLDFEMLARMADYLKDFSCIKKVELLPFHKMGEYKWKELGRHYSLTDVPEPSEEDMKKAAELFDSRGIKL